MSHEPGEQYDGACVVSSGDVEVGATVKLRGEFQPIDGKFHWYGRIAASPELDALGSGSDVTLRTGHGEAPGRLSDVDPWGRFRISGTGRPPF